MLCVASDPTMQRLLGIAEKVAESAVGEVLIEGERGSGRGFLARLIHEKTPGGGGPFVAVPTAAVTAGDLEAEIAAAHGGTLFVGEVADLDLAAQARLLRLVEGADHA